MKIRLLRRTLFVGGLCLLAILASTGQIRQARAPRSARSARIAASKTAKPLPAALSPAALASLAKAAVVTLPWFDNIENGTAGWTSTGFWHTPYRPQQLKILSPTINPDLVTLPDAGYLPAPFSGNYCWWYGENSTGTYIGSNFDSVQQTPLNGGQSVAANSGDLITPPISLVGQKNALLSFATWWEIEGVAADAFDLMKVQVSTDAGVTWNPVGRGELNPLNDPAGADYKPFTSNGLGQKGSWTQQYFDLTPYVGSVVSIRFTFDTGDELYNGFRGWFIDDVGVTGGTLPAPSIIAMSPPVVNPTYTPVVSIIGANFVSGAAIAVDESTVSGGVLSSSLAQFDPTGLATGPHSVTVTNPDGQSVTKLNAFIVSSALPPKFVSVQPDSAPEGIGVPIVITGTNFLTGVSVSIGGVPAVVQKVFGTDSILAVSPATLPVGTYNIVVANSDSLSDLGVLGFTITQFVYNTGDSAAGKAQSLKLAPVSPLYTSGKIYYRIAGRIPYDSLALTGTSGQFSVTLPASAVTIRGVEYYLSLSSLQGLKLFYPSINPDLSPAILPVRVQRAFPPLPPVAMKYKMFSSPMILDNPLVISQLGDDYGAYNPAQWRVFRWIKNAYRELGVLGGVSLDPGNAFWVITSTGTPFSLKKGASVPGGGQPYYVPVDTGWNQIGNPFAFNVSWHAVGGSAVMSGPYYYDGTQYRIVPVLEPYEGYFVYNSLGSDYTVLAFPDSETVIPAVHKDGGASYSPGPGEFLLQLSVSVPGTEYRDTYNYVGFRAGATSGRDRLDAPKPPPIGDGVRLNILDGGVQYLENYRAVAGEGTSWVIELRSTSATGSAVLTLVPSGTLPAGYSVHVLDLVDGNALPASAGSFPVTIDGPSAPRYFKVIMGTEKYAEGEAGGIPLRPVSYALGQNFPNPFNPATTIRYALAKTGDVTLEIYNMLGQKVRTLFSGTRATGEYEAQWDGTADNGSHVASGVYFYRLRSGEFNAVRKLVMIR
jgi:hypothetical protein